jgi:hypothetical protein
MAQRSFRQKRRKRALNDDPVRHVRVAHGLFCEQQALEIDRLDRDAIEFDRLGVMMQGFVCMAVGMEQRVHHEGVGNPDVLAFFL